MCAVKLKLRLNINIVILKQNEIKNRLDFLTFNIAQPASSTVCSTDTFQVSGASSVVPTICGENTGQHSNAIIYIMFSFK